MLLLICSFRIHGSSSNAKIKTFMKRLECMALVIWNTAHLLPVSQLLSNSTHHSLNVIHLDYFTPTYFSLQLTSTTSTNAHYENNVVTPIKYISFYVWYSIQLNSKQVTYYYFQFLFKGPTFFRSNPGLAGLPRVCHPTHSIKGTIINNNNNNMLSTLHIVAYYAASSSTLRVSPHKRKINLLQPSAQVLWCSKNPT